MKVIIKHAHAVARIGLQWLVKDYRRNSDVVRCKDIAETARVILASTRPVDLLVYGMNSDEVGEMKQLLAMAREHWQGCLLPTLVISECYERVYAPLCISAGARGFVSMGENTTMILSAMKTVSIGGIFVNRKLARHPIILEAVEKGYVDIFNLFSGREKEIARQLVTHASLRDISKRLGLSYTTVATYRERILKKANVADISQLAMLMSSSASVGRYRG